MHQLDTSCFPREKMLTILYLFSKEIKMAALCLLKADQLTEKRLEQLIGSTSRD